MKTSLVAIALLLLGSEALPAATPSAGSQLQQVPTAPDPVQAPLQWPGAPRAAAVAPVRDDATLVVQSLNLVDARHFTVQELVAATGFKPGDVLTLTALRGHAATIAAYYRERGYFLAQANLPTQDVVDGVVTIAIVEGEYGQVVLRNASRLSDGLVYGLLDGLETGDPISIAPLETRLLLLSDLRGVNIRSTLVPGASVGASDLIVDVRPGRRVTGSVDVDNSGSRYTGEERSGATLNLNNPLGRGDVASLRAFTSWQGLDYGRAAYQQQFGRGDAGVAFTALDYRLGREFEALQAHGTAQITSVYGRYPLRRSRSNNLFAQANVDSKTFRDTIDGGAGPTAAAKTANVALLSLVGDHRDRLWGGGVSTYSLTWTSGRLDLRDASARSADAASARSAGHYDKLGISAMRLQSLGPSLSLYASVQGQLTGQNLDASEKLALGGVNGVRAYAEGDLYVDQGLFTTLELRLALPRVTDRVPGQLQLVGFVDHATGALSAEAWSAGPNRRTLSGGGLGLNWFDGRRFEVKAHYAHTIGAGPRGVDFADVDRVWLHAVKYF